MIDDLLPPGFETRLEAKLEGLLELCGFEDFNVHGAYLKKHILMATRSWTDWVAAEEKNARRRARRELESLRRAKVKSIQILPDTNTIVATIEHPELSKSTKTALGLQRFAHAWKELEAIHPELFKEGGGVWSERVDEAQELWRELFDRQSLLDAAHIVLVAAGRPLGRRSLFSPELYVLLTKIFVLAVKVAAFIEENELFDDPSLRKRNRWRRARSWAQTNYPTFVSDVIQAIAGLPKEPTENSARQALKGNWGNIWPERSPTLQDIKRYDDFYFCFDDETLTLDASARYHKELSELFPPAIDWTIKLLS